jgi:hypothetical protein
VQPCFPLLASEHVGSASRNERRLISRVVRRTATSRLGTVASVCRADARKMPFSRSDARNRSRFKSIRLDFKKWRLIA